MLAWRQAMETESASQPSTGNGRLRLRAALISLVVGIVLLGIMLALAGFIVGPLMFGSAYASYVDVFDGAKEDLANPAYRGA